MMCAFGELWWIFLFVAVIAVFVIILAPTEATKVGLISGAVCLVCIVLLVIAGGAKSDIHCKELKYQAVLDKRPGLVQECPDREKPSCQLQWIRYQQDSLNKYLHVLQ
jgi:hypothetical protein